MIRVALYARYSSDSQSAASIADQFRLCRELAMATFVFEERDSLQ